MNYFKYKDLVKCNPPLITFPLPHSFIYYIILLFYFLSQILTKTQILLSEFSLVEIVLDVDVSFLRHRVDLHVVVHLWCCWVWFSKDLVVVVVGSSNYYLLPKKIEGKYIYEVPFFLSMVVWLNFFFFDSSIIDCAFSFFAKWIRWGFG